MTEMTVISNIEITNCVSSAKQADTQLQNMLSDTAGQHVYAFMTEVLDDDRALEEDM